MSTTCSSQRTHQSSSTSRRSNADGLVQKLNEWRDAFAQDTTNLAENVEDLDVKQLIEYIINQKSDDLRDAVKELPKAICFDAKDDIMKAARVVSAISKDAIEQFATTEEADRGARIVEAIEHLSILLSGAIGVLRKATDTAVSGRIMKMAKNAMAFVESLTERMMSSNDEGLIRGISATIRNVAFTVKNACLLLALEEYADMRDFPIEAIRDAML